MTIADLIKKVKEEKPNSFTDEKLISFINEVEVEVAEQLRLTGTAYTSLDMSKLLLAPAPYDSLYVSYVKSQIDYSNEEYESYENNQAQHVQDFRDFSDWVVREKKVENSTFPTKFVNVL